MGLRVGSAFSGIGGFEQGLRLSGLPHKVVWACDTDEYANETYFANYGVAPENSLWGMPEGLDLFTAGFPCTPFSAAGKRNGRDHHKGNLGLVTAHLINELKPKYFILENVPELLQSDVFDEMLRIINQSVWFGLINSADLGVPMKRNRAFITNFPWDYPVREISHKDTPMKKVLVSPIGRTYYNIDRLIDGALDGKLRTQGYRVYSDEQPAPSISKRMRLLVSNGAQIFKPSVREYYNIFGFPADFKIHPRVSHALNQIGNSIAPACIAHILKYLPVDK